MKQWKFVKKWSFYQIRLIFRYNPKMSEIGQLQIWSEKII